MTNENQCKLGYSASQEESSAAQIFIANHGNKIRIYENRNQSDDCQRNFQNVKINSSGYEDGWWILEMKEKHPIKSEKGITSTQVILHWQCVETQV